MATMAEASYLQLLHQFPANRASFLSTGSDQKDHASMRQQKLATAAALDLEQAFQEANRKSHTEDEDDLQHILDTTKQKHYRRRRSSVVKQPKAASQELQEKQSMQQVALQEEEERTDQGSEHGHYKAQQMQFQQESQQLQVQLVPVDIQEIMHAELFDSSPTDLQRAIVIHKPRPLPLRTDVRMPWPGPACVKLLFDREYEFLVQWHKKDFKAFTEEVQASLGGTLKKNIREYERALDLHRQPSFGKIDAATTAGAAPAVSTNSSSDKGDGQESDDNVSLKTRQKHLMRSTCEKEENHVGNSMPHQAGDGRERHSKHRKLDSEAKDMQELQKQKMERVLDSFVKARDAVVSIREASLRIEEHKAWMLSELNLTRLELMNLKFSRCLKPRSVLREAMELAATVRSFIMEISSAIDRDDLGSPWPLPRKADCSDITPLFLKHLV